MGEDLRQSSIASKVRGDGVSVKPGLWTGLDYGLDYGLDWLDYQNCCIQTVNAAKATTAFLQLCLKLLPSRLRHQFLDFCEVKGHMHI